ncbi:nwd1 protein, partial [Fusarium langsethiae]
AIEIAPLQAYSSALVFSPEHSLTRELFKKEEPDWMVLKPRMEADWNACLQTLEGHGDSVTSVVFSADGQRIASGSDDNTVKIWRSRARIWGSGDSLTVRVMSTAALQVQPREEGASAQYCTYLLVQKLACDTGLSFKIKGPGS